MNPSSGCAARSPLFLVWAVGAIVLRRALRDRRSLYHPFTHTRLATSP
jgi:hypothetical protein